MSVEEQAFRLGYAYGQVFPLLAPKNRFLPFQIFVPGSVDIDVSVSLSNVDGSVVKDITAGMTEAGMTVIDFENTTEYDSAIIFPGITDKDVWKEFGLDFNNDFSLEDFGGEYSSGEGRAYLIVSVKDNETGSVTKYYSEVMTLISDTSECLKLQWYSFSDLKYEGGKIIYKDVPYSNILYVRADIGTPSYSFEEEGEERNGRYFPTKQISEKRYRFSFLATEQVCDALRLMGLSDVAMITDGLGREYLCDSFLMTPEWQPQGYLARVECEFQTDTMVVQPARLADIDAVTPAFYQDGKIADPVQYFKSTEEHVFTVTVVPPLPGMRVYAQDSSWVEVQRLCGDTYKIRLLRAEQMTDRATYIIAEAEYGQRGSILISESNI